MTTQAQLSDSLITPELKDLMPLTTVYTVPWAMVVDTHKKCWLVSTYSYKHTPGGTVQLQVTKDLFGKISCKLLKHFTWEITNVRNTDNLIPVYKFSEK